MLKTRTLSRLLPLLFLLPFVSQSGYAGIPGENDLNQMASDAISKVGTYKSMPINLLEETKFQGVSLSIDSLRYIRGNDVNGVKDDHVYINAEADIQLPFAVSANGDKVIKFKGINLPLAGEGNIRIGLVSTHEINIIKDKVKMVIKPSMSSGTKAELGDCKSSDSTFVEFNCNGVKDVGLVGHFEFSNTFLEPATPGKNGDKVLAHFAFTYSEGLLAKVCFSDSFKVKGCGDFVFHVIDAIADFSEGRNGGGFKMPDGYWEETGLPEEAWMGFFLKELAVRFPKDLDLNKKKDKNAEVKVANVLIDDFGFTGTVLLNNFIDTKGDNNGGLNIAVDTVGVEFWQNDLAGGLIAGQADVPFLDKNTKKDAEGVEGYNMRFRGEVGYNKVTDKFLYNVSLATQTDNEFKVPFTNKATIKINKGSHLDIGNKNEKEEFTAALCMNGSLNIQSKLSLKGVNFEELKFSTARPHVSVKSMALNGELGCKFGGFGIALKRLEVQIPPTSDPEEVKLGIIASIELISGSGTIGADAGFQIHCVNENKWKFQKLEVDEIGLNLDFTAFHFEGHIRHFEDHSDYGNGFRGSLELTLKEFGFGVKGEILFGKKDDTRYWFTKATADVSSFHLLLFPPGVFIKSFSGGCYYHVSRPIISDPSAETVKIPTVIDYKPADTVGFGFIAGMGVYFMDKKLCGANVEFEMNFNTHWGVNYVSLIGVASVLKEMTIADQTSKGVIGAWLSAHYDRPNKTFHAGLGIDINFAGILKGAGKMTIHSDPKEWYVWVGDRNNPNTLDFAKILKSKSYFMLGKIPTSLPPMVPAIAAKQGITKSSAEGQDGAIYGGKGFAFGVGIESGAKVSLPLDILFAGFELDAGVDVLVGTGQCRSVDWRASGRAYFYAEGHLGASIPVIRWCKWHPCIKKKKVNIFSGESWALLEGSIPAPAYFDGKLGFKCKILFIKLPNIRVGITVGENC